jgi:hypothetical protein
MVCLLFFDLAIYCAPECGIWLSLELTAPILWSNDPGYNLASVSVLHKMLAGPTVVRAFCGMLKTDFIFAERFAIVWQLALDHP